MPDSLSRSTDLFIALAKVRAIFLSFFWGLPPLAAGPLQGLQVCSALRFGATHLRLLPLVVELRPKGLGLPLRSPLSGP